MSEKKTRGKDVHVLAREFKRLGYGLKDMNDLEGKLGRKLDRAERRALNIADGKFKGAPNSRITTATDIVQNSDEKLYQQRKTKSAKKGVLNDAFFSWRIRN